jgi:hypothetical protein
MHEEEYIRDFQSIQFQISMFNSEFDEMFFVSHFVNDLRDDIKHVVQTQLPDTVDKANLLAQIRQQALSRTKFKSTKWAQAT